MTKAEVRSLREKETMRLGHKFPVFLDYDQNECVRNAIFDFNHRPRNKYELTDEMIADMMERLKRRSLIEGEMMLNSINNPTSRMRGLYAVLGKDLFRLINRDGNLRGVLTPFAKDVRMEYRPKKKKLLAANL